VTLTPTNLCELGAAVETRPAVRLGCRAFPSPGERVLVAGGLGLTPWFPSMAGSCRSVLLEQAPIRRAEVSSILFSSPRVFLCAASFLERSRLRLAWDEDSEEEKTGRQTEEA